MADAWPNTTSLVSGRDVRVAFLLTRFRITWPVDGSSDHYDPPFTDATGYPSLDTGTTVPEVMDYSVTADDDLGAASLILTIGNPDDDGDGMGDNTLFFQANDLVKIEERYEGPDGTSTAWQTVGWFMVDGFPGGVAPSGATITVRGRDAIKLLTLDVFSGRLGGDLIKVMCRGQVQSNPLALDPVPALGPVILREVEIDVAGFERDPRHLPTVLPAFTHHEPNDVPVPGDAGLEIADGQAGREVPKPQRFWLLAWLLGRLGFLGHRPSFVGFPRKIHGGRRGRRGQKGSGWCRCLMRRYARVPACP